MDKGSSYRSVNMIDPHREIRRKRYDPPWRTAEEGALMVAATKAVSPALAVGPQWVALSRPSEAGLMTALLMGGADAGTGPTGYKTGARFISPS